MNLKTYAYKSPFQLESGKQLQELTLSYSTLGKLNKEKDNVIWITHALTAGANPSEWWKGLVGEGKTFDPDKDFIVCANVLGSCYGSTGPLSENPSSEKPYFHSFPEITIRDIVKSLDLLRVDLKIEKINTLIGGSLGGQQALEWSIQQPELIENLFLIATNAQHSPWGIAFNESQRLAIKTDTTWSFNTINAGTEGLKTARSIALLSYRNYDTYAATQEDNNNKTSDYKAASYQNYQGKKLADRFNAFSYWHLSKAMDSHNVARGRVNIKKALSMVKAKTLVVSISSDILFPVSEGEALSNGIENSSFVIIDSLYGHDGFLIETEQLKREIDFFYQKKRNTKIKRVIKTNFKN